MSDLKIQLLKAIEAGSLSGVRASLAEGADVHADGEAALRWAVEYGHTTIVQCLLDAGADVNVRRGVALQSAAEHGHLAIVQALLSAGADVHAEEDIALRWAAEHGQQPVYQCLLWAGANVHPQDDDADLQLAACASGDPTQVYAAMLARQGVCPEALCVLLKRQGQTALAAMLSSTQMLEPLPPDARGALIEALLQNQPHPESNHGRP